MHGQVVVPNALRRGAHMSNVGIATFSTSSVHIYRCKVVTLKRDVSMHYSYIHALMTGSHFSSLPFVTHVPPYNGSKYRLETPVATSRSMSPCCREFIHEN